MLKNQIVPQPTAQKIFQKYSWEPEGKKIKIIRQQNVNPHLILNNILLMKQNEIETKLKLIEELCNLSSPSIESSANF